MSRTPPFTRSGLDALGKRLKSDEVSESDWRQLESVLGYYQDALDEVTGRLSQQGFQPASRIKSTDTLIDKLRRGTSFKSLQDIAGARVVIGDSRTQQDQAVDLIGGLFAEPRIVDRRQSPMHAYRAVHVVIQHHGVPVEVQVRTTLQDLWAQAMERFADRWGRGIRYGEPLDDPDWEILPDLTCGHLLDLLFEFSELLDLFESSEGDQPGDQVSFERAARDLEKGIARIDDIIS